jgi:hypothetical protein
MFPNVPWMFLECSLNFPECSSMFLECSLNVPRMFPECSRMFPECSSNGPWMFLNVPECSLNLPRMLQVEHATVKGRPCDCWRGQSQCCNWSVSSIRHRSRRPSNRPSISSSQFTTCFPPVCKSCLQDFYFYLL